MYILTEVYSLNSTFLITIDYGFDEIMFDLI